MKPEIKQLWLEALQSNQYEQTMGNLGSKTRDGECFCALGVLCELAVKAGVVYKVYSPLDHIAHYSHEHPSQAKWVDDPYSIPSHWKDTSLPGPVMEWAGIESCDGSFCECVYTDRDGNIIDTPEYVSDDGNSYAACSNSIVDLNDDIGMSFAKIAQVIDKYF